MIENTQENPGAVVIDGHGRADLGLVRALGEQGVPVYLLSDDPGSAVHRSRYVTDRLDFPPRSAPATERVAALAAIGQRFRHPPVFFSTGDTSLVLFSRHREQLEPYYRHHIGEPELVEGLYDKIRFARLAQARGLPVPYTSVPSSLRELEDALDHFSFPVMVKPAEKRNWDAHPEIHALTAGNLKGVRIETPEELLTFYRAVEPLDPRVVIQDYIEGRDDAIYSLHAYIDRSGEVTGAFTGQKLRTYPVHRGIGCFQVSVYEPAVVEAGLNALLRLGYTGHAVVQMKRLPGTDSFQIFEINARYSTWNYLHTRAGVNLPYAAYRDSLGEKPEPLPAQRDGVRWIDFGNDRRALAAYRELGEWSTGAWLRSYFGTNCYALWDWRDPLPVLAPAAQGITRLLTYPGRRWARRRLENKEALDGQL